MIPGPAGLSRPCHYCALPRLPANLNISFIEMMGCFHALRPGLPGGWCMEARMRTVIGTLLSPGDGGRVVYDLILTGIVVMIIWAAVR